jgi:dienelactone hydrolase
VERLKSAGVDIALTEYPGAHHSYDTRRANADPVLVPQGVTTRNCSMLEGEDGVILNAATRKPFTYSDACVERGPHVGYNEAAAQATKRAVLDFLTARLHLGQ